MLVHGGGYLVDSKSLTLSQSLFGLLAIAVGALILIGFVTPVAGILASLGGVGLVLSWFPAPLSSLLVAWPMILLVVTVAIAIVCLGPGAFSLDARLFGRREIIIPRAQRSPRS